MAERTVKQEREQDLRPGQGPLRDELRPREGEPVPQQEPRGGEQRDTAGQHGAMKPEAARGLPREQGK